VVAHRDRHRPRLVPVAGDAFGPAGPEDLAEERIARVQRRLALPTGEVHGHEPAGLAVVEVAVEVRSGHLGSPPQELASPVGRRVGTAQPGE